MATTSIWSVKGWLGKVVIYVENPEKTTAPEIAKLPGYETQKEGEEQSLSDVIAYAVNEEKTRRKGKKGEGELASETEKVMQQYVSGINCTPATARSEMMAVKKRYGKDEGIMAFHGYQSFAPGECTPQWHMRSVSVWHGSCGESVFRCWLPLIWIRPIIFTTTLWSILFPMQTGNGITGPIRITVICALPPTAFA